MNINITNKDYLWSYAGIFLSLLANVILTPFVMYFLDGDSFGLWGIFQSLAAITTLFDFGFSTTFSRNINYCWNGANKLIKNGMIYSESSKPNFYLMKKTMKACRIVFLLLALLAFILLSTVGTMYISYISFSIKGQAPIISWCIYSFAIFLNLYYGYYGSFLRGVGAISDVNKATVISRLTQIVLTIFFLWLGGGLVGISVAYLVYGTLFRQLAKKRFYKYKGIGEGMKRVTVDLPKKEIRYIFFVVWHNAWREGMVSLANYLANQSCTIINSLYMPLTQTGAYSLAVQIASAVSQVSAVMYTTNQPVLQSACINNDTEKQKRTMSLIIVSFTFLNIAGVLFIVTVGLPLLRLIRPEAVVSVSVMLGIGIYQFVLKFRNCYTSYFSCTNRIPYVKAFLLSSVVCVIFAIISMGYFKWGAWGLIGSQLISQGVYNAWAWTRKAHQEMKLSFRETRALGYDELRKIVIDFFSGRGKK